MLKIPWVPQLKYLPNVVSRVPRIKNCQRGWDFRFDLVQNTPLKMKTWLDWGTLDLSWSRVSLWKWKLSQIEGLWIWVSPEHPPPAKMKLENLCVETNCCIPCGYHLVLLLPLLQQMGLEPWTHTLVTKEPIYCVKIINIETKKRRCGSSVREYLQGAHFTIAVLNTHHVEVSM